jgi:hypothetical protein
VIEAGCPRRLEDEDVVGRQSIEPYALRRRGEKAPQSFDGRGNLVVGAPAREIGTNPFCLRPQARDRVVDAAVGKYGVHRHAAARIEPAGIGECDEARHCLRLVPAGEPRPAIEQKCPFVLVSRLADASIHARRRRPVGGKELAQRAACRINEFLQA